MTSLNEKLLSTVVEPTSNGKNKVTVVGVGQVGMACAFSILTNVSKLFIVSFLIYDKITCKLDMKSQRETEKDICINLYFMCWINKYLTFCMRSRFMLYKNIRWEWKHDTTVFSFIERVERSCARRCDGGQVKRRNDGSATR